MVLYGTQCTGTWYRKSTAYPYTEYREVYIRYLGLKFGDMDRRLRSIPVSDLCACSYRRYTQHRTGSAVTQGLAMAMLRPL